MNAPNVKLEAIRTVLLEADKAARRERWRWPLRSSVRLGEKNLFLREVVQGTGPSVTSPSSAFAVALYGEGDGPVRLLPNGLLVDANFEVQAGMLLEDGPGTKWIVEHLKLWDAGQVERTGIRAEYAQIITA